MSLKRTVSVRALILIAVLSLIAAAAFAGTISYVYDELNRLKEAHYPDGTIIKYEYDKIGNITYKEMFKNPYTLTVQMDGAGTGTVSSSPTGMSCGIFCTAKFNEGTVVTLTANPSSGDAFGGWSGGGCSGMGPCTVTLNADTTITATFNDIYVVSVSLGDHGSIAPSLSQNVAYGTTTSFTLTPHSGYHIDSVTGCGGTLDGNTYTTAAITADCTVSATFAIDRHTLTVAKTGNGTGTVTGTSENGTGISCGADCSEAYDNGTQVTLTSVPSDSCKIFTGWDGGGCNGTGTCSVSLTSDITVTATFSYRQPGANFDASPRVIDAPADVTFTDQSSCATAWRWDFGDSDPNNTNLSTAPSPTYGFRLPGTYTVSLTVSNPDGSDTKVIADLITANPCPNYPAKIEGTFYQTLAEALTTAASGDTIKLQAVDFTENPISGGSIAIDKHLILEGGYNCWYAVKTTGKTAIEGSVTIGNGDFPVKMDSISLTSPGQ